MQQPLVRHRRRLTAAATIVAAAVALTVTGSTGAGSGAAAEAGVAVPAADTIAPASSALTLSMEVKPGQPVPLALITEKAAAGLYAGGHRGQGIDVAIIDSGVAPVVGLDQPGKMLHGPDLSNEGGFQNVANLDTYGHGTHLAGIIAGDDGGEVVGIAPESRLVSLKVADATGAVDIAQVIAAIEWVVEHKNDNGLNIRVLNLSLGVDGVATNLGDPLSIAVERAWDAGIVVVAAAGNRGNGAPGIDSPAISPYVIAVGGTESYDSDGYSDKVAPWSSRGNAYRAPDVVAPGRSIKSFRVPGSMLDQQHPNAKVGDKHFRGSGTSQSAAVVSGFAAAVLSADPSLTPDQFKFLLQLFADDLAAGNLLDGHGRLDVAETVQNLMYKAKAPVQNHARADGSGGSGPYFLRPTTDLKTTTGYLVGDPTLAPDSLAFDTTVSTIAPIGDSWSGGSWDGNVWSGGTWSGATWSGATWSGATWSGATWSGATWSGASWSGASWSGDTWSSDHSLDVDLTGSTWS